MPKSPSIKPLQFTGYGHAVNRGALFGPDGRRTVVYDKIHMFDVSLDHGESWRESKIYRSGDQAVIADIGSFILGLSICYDIRFPKLYRDLALAGATFMTCPAAFTRQTGEKHWEVLLRARAIETGSYMVAAAQGGIHHDGRTTYGHSMIVGPWGEIVAKLDHDEPGILLADLDLAKPLEARARIPNLQHGRPFKPPIKCNTGQQSKMSATQ